MWSNTNREKSKSKKLKYTDNDISSKHSKSRNSSKSNKKYHCCKLAHANTASDYIGPDRLTKHVGIFNKGKISNSITRVEKILPKEMKARAKQDLQQVLKLTNGVKRKKKDRKIIKSANPINNFDFTYFSANTPLYMHHKTGFASTSWKDKLQKSVGTSATCSVLTSIQKSPHKTSPVRDELIAREVILNKLYPSIKMVNSIMFPTTSNKESLKNTLLQIKEQLLPPSTQSSIKTSISSCVSESLQNSVDSKTMKSDNINNDFHLSPIFTGDSIDNNDITNIFPASCDFLECDDDDDLSVDIDTTNLSNHVYNEIASQPPSSCSRNSSLKLIPTSPTSSDNSPAWKVQVSPAKFIPNTAPTPNIYFRHKMF